MWRLMFSARRVTHFGWTKSPNERSVEKKHAMPAKKLACVRSVCTAPVPHTAARARGGGGRGGGLHENRHTLTIGACACACPCVAIRSV